MNSYKVIGRLGADPETRYTNDGKAVCNFSVASREYNDGTEWHRVVCFGKLAENCGQYLAKGREVYAGGRHQTRKWDDKDGKTQYSSEMVAHTVEFLGSKGDDRPVDTPSGDVDKPGADEPFGIDPDEDDCPF
jgi:single-strand DNA-binding protein